MQFESLADFINMNGHGVYVWAVYLIGITTLVINVLRPIALQKQFYAQQLRALKIEEIRQQDTDAGGQV